LLHEEHDSALVLHTRAYKETSLIVQFFTRDLGRIAGVMRGARRRKGGHLQPFAVGMLAFAGRSNLVTVTKFEQARSIELHADALVAGFYVLELLTRLIDERQSEPTIFDATHVVLARLASGLDVQRCLRPYELLLLDQLGYGIDFRYEADSGKHIEPGKRYVFKNEFGFCEVAANESGRYLGSVLLAIADDDFSDNSVAHIAKRIVRLRLAPLLGERPLVSRKMLRIPSQE
jgi:DNA repair protein RecO (recombination protein O)